MMWLLMGHHETRDTYLSLFLSLQAVIFRVAKGPFVEEFYQCVAYGFYTAPWQEQLYTSLSLLFMFLIPLCIHIATYTTTFATIAMVRNACSARYRFSIPYQMIYDFPNENWVFTHSFARCFC
ncbi:uncharacterized protein CEXT_83221 [Caerostris extrusa]|uniref:Uncharacterized protein n=1 Tax=Caerostris extrusa TaxID=172846 RepID=A0AAV4MGN5_CAEEX|nr:uncharacterized protein CEXT_83221 [Caerostris extrusa]